MKKVIRLPISGQYKANLEIELKEKTRSYDGQRTVDLELVPEKFYEFSVCGVIWSKYASRQVSGQSYGQNIEDIAKLYPHSRRVQRIAQIWREWHLNDLNAGTRTQKAFMEKYEADHPGWRYDYGQACEILRAAGLYEDRGYEYGSAWLLRVLPENVKKEIEAI